MNRAYSRQQTGPCERAGGASRTRCAAAVAVVLLAATSTVALSKELLHKLLLNGAVASTNVRMLDGVPYVPVADVAAALGQHLKPVPGGYEIGMAGGANQVQGLTGRVGDVLFDGNWRFQVTATGETSGYKERYTENEPREWVASDGQRLYYVDVTLKNGSNRQNWLQMYTADDKILTALAGKDGDSIRFTSFDMRTASGKHYGGGGTWDWTPRMLPGSEQKFTILFKIPADFRPKDLIFTLPYPTNGEGSRLKYVHLRIALTKE